MKPARKAERILGCCSVLILLSSCGEPEPDACGAPDTRTSVVKIVSDNHNNSLVNFAAKNSNSVAAMMNGAQSEADKSAIFEKARADAVYSLDQAVRMKSRDKSTATCAGSLAVTVADTTAEKEIEFKVEQTADGKTSVSVSPFLF